MERARVAAPSQTPRKAAGSTRFVALDGMRGVAALSVACLHAHSLLRGSSGAFPNVGLAVDFFFCLSGFVVAQAYDQRLRDDMGLWAFMEKRIKRLYPMILAGVVLGLAAHLYVSDAPAGQAVSDAIAAAAVLPIGALQHRLAFPTNLPMWSLFFEIAACIGYGLAVKFVPDRTLPWILGFLGACLGAAVLVAGRATDFGVFGAAGFLAAFLRVGYPFLAGALLSRAGVHKVIRRKPPVIAATALLAVLFFPAIWLGPYQALAVLIVLPAILLIGAATPLGARMTRGADWLGELSYPLYLVHFPTLMIVHAMVGGRLSAPQDAGLGIACSICVAQLALTFYDKPVRAWLGATRLRTKVA